MYQVYTKIGNTTYQLSTEATDKETAEKSIQTIIEWLNADDLEWLTGWIDGQEYYLSDSVLKTAVFFVKSELD